MVTSFGRGLMKLVENREAIVRTLGKSFAKEFLQEDPFERGRFHGHIAGYVLAGVALAAAAGPAGAALIAAGKYAKLVKLVRAVSAAAAVTKWAKVMGRSLKFPEEVVASQVENHLASAQEHNDKPAGGRGTHSWQSPSRQHYRA